MGIQRTKWGRMGLGKGLTGMLSLTLSTLKIKEVLIDLI